MSILKVMHTVPDLNPSRGGPSRSVAELAIALSQQAALTSVWTPRPQREEWTTSIRNAGVSILCGDLPNRLQAERKSLLIHDNGLWLPVNHSVARHARRRGISRIVSPRGMLEPWALNYRKCKKKLAWALYQRHDLQKATALHATAMSEAENFRRLGLKAPIFVIPNGIQPPPNGCESWKSSSRDGDEKRRAVFLSRVHPKKGLPLLAEAWSRVRPEGWAMSVIGPDEGGHRAEIVNLTKRLGIESEWEFHEQALGEEKWRRLAEAELMILPTHSENFGNVVPEALMVETPVITTTGAPWQGLEGNRCGWWTEPTVEGIEAALRSALSKSSAELREMGVRGRQWVLREFAWPDLAKRMLAAYVAVLTGTRTGDFID